MKIYYNKGDKNLIEFAIDNGENVLLEGESGTGKTSMIKEIANERNKKLVRINLNGQTGVEDIIGYKTVTGGNVEFVYGALVDAMREGNWIVFDELNSANPEVLFALQSLLDDDRFIILKEWHNEKIEAHPDFRFFATQNPPTNYAGTKELNGATLSRFGCVLTIDYAEKEPEILVERTGIDLELANNLVTCANAIREMTRKGELMALCTTRDLLQVAKMIKMGVDKQEALEVCVVNKAKIDEREQIKKVFELNLDMRFKVRSGKKVIALSPEEIKEVENRIDEKIKVLDTKRAEFEKLAQQKSEQLNKNFKEVFKGAILEQIKDSESDLKDVKKLREFVENIFSIN